MTPVLVALGIGAVAFYVLAQNGFTFGGSGCAGAGLCLDVNCPIGFNGGCMNKLIIAMAQGIAVGEGFSGTLPDGTVNTVSPASKGTRLNNPGDIGILQNRAYPSLVEGWAALYNELSLIFRNGSHYYQTSMTVQQFIDVWTADKPNSAEEGGYFAAIEAALAKYGFSVSITDTLDSLWQQTQTGANCPGAAPACPGACNGVNS